MGRALRLSGRTACRPELMAMWADGEIRRTAWSGS